LTLTYGLERRELKDIMGGCKLSLLGMLNLTYLHPFFYATTNPIIMAICTHVLEPSLLPYTYLHMNFVLMFLQESYNFYFREEE